MNEKHISGNYYVGIFIVGFSKNERTVQLTLTALSYQNMRKFNILDFELPVFVAPLGQLLMIEFHQEKFVVWVLKNDSL